MIASRFDAEGPRAVIRACIVALAPLTALLVVLSYPPARYMGLSPGEFATACALAFPLMLIAVAGIALDCRRPFRAMTRWHEAGRDPALAPAARAAAFALPTRAMRDAALCVAWATPVAVLLLVVHAEESEPLDWLLLGFGFAVNEALTLVLLVRLMVETALRPVRVALGGTQDDPGDRPGRLVRRIVPSLLSLSYSSCVFCALLFVERADTGPWGIAYVYAAALTVTAVWAALVLPVLSEAVLAPVRDLAAGHRTVGRGDLAAVVPVTTRDELGELAASFNEMVAELRAAQARVVAAGDDARRRVERDLHDGAQQQLVLVALQLRLLQRRLAGEPEAAGLAGEIQDALAAALADLRALARGIYPAALEEDGLAAALEASARSAALPVTVRADDVPRVAREVEAAVFFCCLEALQNAAKYAGEGATATVTLGAEDGALAFAVEDDGVGFSPGDRRGGLRNIQDRIGALGGWVEVRSEPGAGTTVRGRVPVPSVVA